jgi:hypothetical protein
VGDLDRFQPLSLAAAALTLLLSLLVSNGLLVRVMVIEIALLVMIWCGEMIGKFIGFGITQETPGCFVAGIGWAGQLLLLIGVSALAAVTLFHR